MLFTFLLIDKPGKGDIRQNVRPLHKEYLGLMADKMAFAGPLVHDDGKTMLGSLLVIDFPNRDTAHEWLANEPFTKAGLYASVTIHAFVNLWEQKAGFPEKV